MRHFRTDALHHDLALSGLRKLIAQRLGVDEIGRTEALGKLAIDSSEYSAGLG